MPPWRPVEGLPLDAIAARPIPAGALPGTDRIGAAVPGRSVDARHARVVRRRGRGGHRATPLIVARPTGEGHRAASVAAKMSGPSRRATRPAPPIQPPDGSLRRANAAGERSSRSQPSSARSRSVSLATIRLRSASAAASPVRWPTILDLVSDAAAATAWRISWRAVAMPAVAGRRMATTASSAPANQVGSANGQAGSASESSGSTKSSRRPG